jgi:hypothetical protein
MVVTGRPGARVVSYGPHRGFVERTVRPGYISRTHVVGGRSYAHVYREYRYHGLVYYHYVPAFYYGPGFYTWAVTPWGAPVPYAWGGGIVAPWFGFYAGYFTPYPVYGSPDLWLTDYLVAENLRLAYESQQAEDDGQTPPSAQNAQSAAATLSGETKALIADEVRQQLAAEKAAAASPNQPAAPTSEQAPSALDPAVRVFVVSSAIDVAAGSQECSLTPGDIVTRIDDTPDVNQNVSALVTASKKTDCPTGEKVAVSVQDLQEMHNQFRVQLDSGLKTLAENQARGLPKGPATGARPVAEGTTDPVPDAEAQITTQEADASKLEAQVRQN